ncbi:type II secretion system F family protein [Vibrio sp. 188UL20-2]|uniref:Type II secretion system F family protein n=2 Tax=Vibrio ulleungensis TaxID=2807619 RepID=A0ABS2HQL0_9VIBR|nr:type II secretion system F family protein [Vibrio ulleungensis]
MIERLISYVASINPFNLAILIGAWLVIVGVISFVYSSYVELSRKRTMARYGLQSKEKASKAEKGFGLIESLNDFLSRFLSTSDSEIQEKFAAAGIYNERLSKLFIPLKYTVLAVIVAGVVFSVKRLGLDAQQGLIIGLLLGITVLLGPDMYVDVKAKAMRKKLSDKLPYLIDMMAICVQTGMTIEASIAYLAQEMQGFDPDIARVLQKTSDKARVVGLEKALDDLYARIPTPEFRSFVMTLNQSLQYGSSISNVLTNLSMDIREVQMLTIEERIGALSAKMSIPLILFIMIPIVILITAPGIMRLMEDAPL